MFGIGKKQGTPEEWERAFAREEQEGRQLDRGMNLIETPTTTDITELFSEWTKPSRIKNLPTTKMIIPSFSTTYYPEKSNDHIELYSARNQIATVLLCLVQPLAEEYPHSGFEKFLSMLIVPLEVDNESRRSVGGFMVKEVGTKRAEVTQKRQPSKAGDMIMRRD